jgi:hypothetical protein
MIGATLLSTEPLGLTQDCSSPAELGPNIDAESVACKSSQDAWRTRGLAPSIPKPAQMEDSVSVRKFSRRFFLKGRPLRPAQ